MIIMNDRRINWSAILAGSAVDIGGTFIASILLALVLGAVLTASGSAPAEVQSRLQNDSAFVVLGLILEVVFSGLGAFIAGRLAKHSELLHAGITWGVCLLVGISMSLLWSPPTPVGYYVLSYSLALVAALLGGKLAAASKRAAHAA